MRGRDIKNWIEEMWWLILLALVTVLLIVAMMTAILRNFWGAHVQMQLPAAPTLSPSSAPAMPLLIAVAKTS